MARFGINPKNTCRVSISALRKTAKEIGRDHPPAQRFWSSGVHDEPILGSMVADPRAVTAKMTKCWVQDFDPWDVCDQHCLNL